MSNTTVMTAAMTVALEVLELKVTASRLSFSRRAPPTATAIGMFSRGEGRGGKCGRALDGSV